MNYGQTFEPDLVSGIGVRSGQLGSAVIDAVDDMIFVKTW